MDNIKKAGIFIQKLFSSQTPPKSTASGDKLDDIRDPGEIGFIEDGSKEKNTYFCRRRHTIQLEKNVTRDLRGRMAIDDDFLASSREHASQSRQVPAAEDHKKTVKSVDIPKNSTSSNNENSDQILFARAMARSPSFSYDDIFEQTTFPSEQSSVFSKQRRSKSVSASKNKSNVTARNEQNTTSTQENDRCGREERCEINEKSKLNSNKPTDDDFTKYSKKGNAEANLFSSRNDSIKIPPNTKASDKRNQKLPKSQKDVLNQNRFSSRHKTQTSLKRDIQSKKVAKNDVTGNIKRKLAQHETRQTSLDKSEKLEFPTTPETLLEYHKNHSILDPNEEWLVVELNEYECLIDSLEVIQIIASHSKFFEVNPDELWQEFFEFVEDVPSYDEVINFDVWQEFRDKKYTC